MRHGHSRLRADLLYLAHEVEGNGAAGMASARKGVSGGVTVRGVASIAEIDAAEWDACAGADNPFVSYAFLKALEESGCATEEPAGCLSHLVARRRGRPCAGLRAALSQGPLLRRICVRLGLGRGLAEGG